VPEFDMGWQGLEETDHGGVGESALASAAGEENPAASLGQLVWGIGVRLLFVTVFSIF
jgi:hypothetical protein